MTMTVMSSLEWRWRASSREFRKSHNQPNRTLTHSMWHTFIQFIHDLTYHIQTYLRHNPHMAQLLAFVIAFAESLPLIGTIIPGSVSMTALGMLIGRGVIAGPSTLIWATIGALTGDAVGYFLGFYFKEQLSRIWPFSRYPKILTVGRNFVERHGGKSILIGRFVGPARSSVPMVIGLLHFSPVRFFLAAAPSAILWAILYMVPGILVGALSLEAPPGETVKFIVVGLLVVLGIWLGCWLIVHFSKQLLAAINRWIDRLWHWISVHHRTQPIIRYITNRQNPADHHQLTLLVTSVLLLVLFLLIWLCVVSQSVITGVNLPLFHLFQSIRSHALDAFFITITIAGQPIAMIGLAVLFSVFLAFQRRWRAMAHLLVLTLVTAVCITVIKHLIFIPRPTGLTVVKSSSSFPSGHTTLTLVVIGFISYLTAKRLPLNWRKPCYLISILLIALVGGSRIYLGAHWLTDILGATCLGLGLLLATVMNLHRYPEQQLDSSPKALVIWFSSLAMLILIPAIILISLQYHRLAYNFTPKFIQRTVRLQTWWNAPSLIAPHYRPNRFGKPSQPFNLQWAGSLTNIEHYLSQHGWRRINHHRAPAPSATGSTSDTQKTKQTTAVQLSILPWLYQHKPPALIMVKPLTQSPTLYATHLKLISRDTPSSDTPTPASRSDKAATQSKQEQAMKASIELRLWRSSIVLTRRIARPQQGNSTQPFTPTHTTQLPEYITLRIPLWLGTINIYDPLEKKFSLKQHYQLNFHDPNALTQLMIQLRQAGYRYQIVTVPIEQLPERIQHLNWNRRILVISR